MIKIERRDIYFEEPGAENTDSVVDAVVERVKETELKAWL